jgi:putative intracellular protease/amidase/dienelactone hydrolase
MTTRILIALTSHSSLGDTGRSTGYYVPEAAHPWAAFTRAGYTVDLISPQGGQPPRDGEDPADPVQRQFLEASGGGATVRAKDIDPAGYDAIFFAGGHGTMWDFPADEALQALTRAIYENGGVVAAVCHGPAALTGVTLSDGTYLVEGKRVAAFTNAEEAAVDLTRTVPFLLADRLTEHGAVHVPGPDFQPNVVRDGRLITGQNPASAAGVAETVIAALDLTREWVNEDSYLVRPAAPGSYPAVIMAHQLFGVTADVRDAADRVARLGFAVLAPNFFHRAERNVQLEADDAGRQAGFKLMGELTREGVVADVEAARSYLRDAGYSQLAGMVGLSMGGHLTYYAATQLSLPAAIVLYPGWLTSTDMPVSRPEPTIELTAGITGKLVFIAGDADHVVTAGQRDQIAARLAAENVRHEMVVIEGAPHAFLGQGTATYRPDAAAQAWRVIEQTLLQAR